eukprot:Colp12_sorted_trinity150504_noHs@16198
MTRFARAGKKKEEEATKWGEFANPNPDGGNGKRKRVMSEEKQQKEAERRKRRKMMKKPCYVCRKFGHTVAECPQAEENASGVCYKCGSTEHKTQTCLKNTNGQFPFATCFICKEVGHLSSRCPDNPKGLYPNGGGCKFCNSVEHFIRDCPENPRNKRNPAFGAEMTLDVVEAHESAEATDMPQLEEPTRAKPAPKKKTKVVAF